jgi:ketosteroid isomerase-like protein
MRTLGIVLATLLLAGFALATGSDKEKQVRDLEQRWLAAEDDPAQLEQILADDFLHVGPYGVITKAEQFDFMRKHPRPPRDPAQRHFAELRVRVYGDVAIATGVVSATEAGKEMKTAFTDVFAYRHGRWQAVNAQESPLSSAP